MSEARRYLVVERYEALTVGGKIHSLAKYFDEIETDYQEWEDLKNIQALLSPGNLKRMVVQLMAKAARTVQELDLTNMFQKQSKPVDCCAHHNGLSL